MRIVVDTNVLVSGLISPGGPPGMILNMVINESLRVCYDSRILAEYRAVLERSEFDIAADRISGLLAQIITLGEGVLVSPSQMPLPDPDDIAFLEVSLAAQAECLITGNLKHFPYSCRQGMRVFSPAEFLKFYRDQQDPVGGMVKSSSEKYRFTQQTKNIKNRTPAPLGRRHMSFTEFTRKVDRTRDAGNVDWTPAEVEKVIQSIRRKDGASKQSNDQREMVRLSCPVINTRNRKEALQHLDGLMKNKKRKP